MDKPTKKVWTALIEGNGGNYSMTYCFDNEKEADEFGRKSMRRGFEHKIVEYDNENYERYWK